MLTVNAATAVAELQIAERGNGVVPRCPLTGEIPRTNACARLDVAEAAYHDVTFVIVPVLW